ncbi:41886_t:CDS:1, partial [Gigaspora margarita]
QKASSNICLNFNKAKALAAAKNQKLFEEVLLALTTTASDEIIIPIQSTNKGNKTSESVAETLVQLYQDAWARKLKKKKLPKRQFIV